MDIVKFGSTERHLGGVLEKCGCNVLWTTSHIREEIVEGQVREMGDGL